MPNHLSMFNYELTELLVFVVLWGSSWAIYDYIIQKIAKDNPNITLYLNVCILFIGVGLLYVKNRYIKSPYTGKD